MKKDEIIYAANNKLSYTEKNVTVLGNKTQNLFLISEQL